MKRIILLFLVVIMIVGCSKPNNNTNDPIKEEQTDEIKDTKITFFEGLQTSFYLTDEDATNFIEYFKEKTPSNKELLGVTNKFHFNYEGEDYRCYPYEEAIYFKNFQTGNVYVIEDSYIVNKIYTLMPVEFTETIQNKIEEQPIDIYGYDPAVLTPITLEEGHVFKNENKNDMSGSGYTSIYLDYSCYLEIYNNQLVITDANTLESFIVNDIINPISIAYRGSCGGPLDMSVLTSQNEMYILEGFMYSYSNNKYTTSHNLDILKVETDEAIKEIQVYDDIDVFTTCGNARYYAVTEDESVRHVGSVYDKVKRKITSYKLGKTRDEIYPYTDFLMADTSFKAGKDASTNMLYTFKDNSLHTGYAIDYDFYETWNTDPVLDHEGNIFYMDSCFKLYNTNSEVTDFYIVGMDKYLYTFDYKNANFKENSNLELQKITEFKVQDIKVFHNKDESTNTRTTEVVFTLEDNQSIHLLSNYIHGMGYQKYVVK